MSEKTELTADQRKLAIKMMTNRESNAEIVKGLFVDNGFDGLKAAD